jgi:hypothetical protein
MVFLSKTAVTTTATTVGHRATVTDFSRTTLGHDRLMRAWRSVRRHLVLPALTLGVLMAGCTSSAMPLQSRVPAECRCSRQALAGIVAASAATAAMPAAVQMSFTGASSSERATGSFDFPAGRGSIVLAPAPTAGRSPASARSWALIFLPAIAYYRPPIGSGWKLPPARPWISVDLTAADNLSRSLPRFVPQIENLNPLISLDALRWGAIAATVVGPTMTMDGAQTTRYNVTVDLHTALSKADGPNKTAFLATIGSRIGTAAGSPSASDSSRLELQVWLNDRGRVVQLQTPSLLGVGAITTVLRPLGTPAAVHPPAAIRSVAITSLVPSGERESTGGGDSDGA